MGGLFEKEVAQQALPQNLQMLVQQLLQNKVKYKLKPSKQLRDGFVYSLEFQQNIPPLKFTLDDGNLPTEFSSLIDYFLTAT